MKHVVVTGGSRGIGFGLVNQFLQRNCRVTFTATKDSTLNRATESLSNKGGNNRFKGVVCDVTKINDLNTLHDFATKIFGPVDIWINNAGITNEEKPFWELEPEQYNSVIDVNIKGLMMATQIAFKLMKNQGGGFIYNMGGLGTDGRIIKGLAPYGTSKRAVGYFTEAISKEVKETPVKIGLLLPGMVITDLILGHIRKDPLGSKRFIRILNILADEVEPVTEFLVEKILTNEENGITISYTSLAKTIGKFASAPFSRRDIVSKYL